MRSWVGLLRHGQSTGNVAREEAETAGDELIDIPERDADVPLTDLGRQQAQAAGAWLAEHPPQHVVSSPYRRAVDTARLALAEARRLGADVPAEPVIDERLRDRELGVLDLLTSHGVRERWPDELRRKRRHGKFYYRPPGGESWADVVLRIRVLLGELPRGRLLLVGHEMAVFVLRYILEGVPEPDLLKIAARTAVPNASVTLWRPVENAGYRLEIEQDTAHLHETATPATENDDAAVSLP